MPVSAATNNPSTSNTDLLSANIPHPIRPLSESVILAVAFAVGIFICVVSAVANAFLIATGIPFAGVLMKCDAVGGVVAVLLVWKLLRWSRERNQLARERVRIITELNHEVRNAIQVISLADYHQNGETPTEVKDSVLRIERALHEYVPQGADQTAQSGQEVRTA
jgi:hypothetical protein